MSGLSTRDSVSELVGDVVATVRPSTSLRAAARQLARELVGLLVVVDGDGPHGVLSERDLVAAAAEDADLDAERAIDWASDDIVSVDESATVAEAAAAMASADVRHLAVSRGKEIVGVISARDLVAVLAGEATSGA